MYLFTIVLIIGLYLLDITLLTLNYKRRNHPIPHKVADVYDPSDYAKWLNYTMDKFKLTVVRKSLNTLVLLLMLVLDVFPMIASLVAGFTSAPLIETLLFLVVYGGIYYPLTIGFDLYQTFGIETRYGFNTRTLKTYISDQLKSLILGATLGGGTLALLLTLYIRLGKGSILYAWAILMFILLAINVLYTRLFIPLFNHLTPLQEGELKDKCSTLANKSGYELKKISVIDASKRSTRINAFFTGFGRFKNIVLYDTLIDACSPDEIVAVLAHEIGHGKHRDVLKNLVLTALQLGFYLTLLAYFLSSSYFAQAFGFMDIHYGFAIVLFGLLMAPFGLIIDLPLSAMSRKAEYGADAYAAKAGYGQALASALKVLARENYANLTPHPLVVTLTYSHPPILQRLTALELIASNSE